MRRLFKIFIEYPLIWALTSDFISMWDDTIKGPSVTSHTSLLPLTSDLLLTFQFSYFPFINFHLLLSHFLFLSFLSLLRFCFSLDYLSVNPMQFFITMKIGAIGPTVLWVEILNVTRTANENCLSKLLMRNEVEWLQVQHDTNRFTVHHSKITNNLVI